MTTSQSPISAIRKQADQIARSLKAIERGEFVVEDVGGKLAASRQRESVVFGIFMDDKILKVELSWQTIRDMSEHAISEHIVHYMRGQADNA